jgi:hypothetical protein
VAIGKPITSDWFSLNEARTLLADFYGLSFAGQLLKERMETGEVPYRYWGRQDHEGRSSATTCDDPVNGDPKFWHENAIYELRVNWDESSVRRFNVLWGPDYSLQRIELSRKAVEALLPTAEQNKPQSQEPVPAAHELQFLQPPLMPRDRVKALLPEVYPSKGRPPNGLSLKAIAGAIAGECGRRGWGPPDQNTVARALEDLGFRTRRKPKPSRNRN